MNNGKHLKSELDFERESISKAGRLHVFHWLIIALSLSLTLAAWYFTKQQVEEKVETQFQRQADQVIELILERMEKYEDGLWAGAAAAKALGGEVSLVEWKTFTENFQIGKKYPGVNGIGIIHCVERNQLEEYLNFHRAVRPDFNVFPEHDNAELWPITYIEPVAENSKAVGLDIAHESNRLIAAQNSRTRGIPQITGPINLVQDDEKNPGFLFYVPFYKSDSQDSIRDKTSGFLGLVYAPFVVKHLMEGVLLREKRNIGLSIADGESILYNEHVDSEEDYDPEPLYKIQRAISLHGREWVFDIWTTISFREATKNSTPIVILCGGLLLDALLFLLFFLLTKSNRRTIDFADKVTSELRQQTIELGHTNEELEQFAYIVSHDLQEPVRMVGSFAELLSEQYSEQLDDKANQFLAFITSNSLRMRELISGLFDFSRIHKDDIILREFDSLEAVNKAMASLQTTIQEAGAIITVDKLPRILANDILLTQVFQNLIGNAIKFCKEQQPQIHISSSETQHVWTFSVKDNGIGINQKFAEKIFVIFQRLNKRGDYTGTGIGLSICKKVVQFHGGKIWFESINGEGTNFYFTIPKDKKGAK